MQVCCGLVSRLAACVPHPTLRLLSARAGKSTMLLQAAYNYIERGMLVFLLTAKLDSRAGEGKISSRIGLSMDAHTFDADTDVFETLSSELAHSEREFACVFVDEAQFLTKEQVWQLARFVDESNLPVMCYGLRVDFRGELFPGSAALLAIADEMREVRTICHCGKKATMVVRRGVDGRAAKEGAQVQIGGNEVYVSLCRRHWRQEVGDEAPPMPRRPTREQTCGAACGPTRQAVHGTSKLVPSSVVLDDDDGDEPNDDEPNDVLSPGDERSARRLVGVGADDGDGGGVESPN